VTFLLPLAALIALHAFPTRRHAAATPTLRAGVVSA
jgi:hypothetical protein